MKSRRMRATASSLRDVAADQQPLATRTETTWIDSVNPGSRSESTTTASSNTPLSKIAHDLGLAHEVEQRSARILRPGRIPGAPAPGRRPLNAVVRVDTPFRPAEPLPRCGSARWSWRGRSGARRARARGETRRSTAMAQAPIAVRDGASSGPSAQRRSRSTATDATRPARPSDGEKRDRPCGPPCKGRECGDRQNRERDARTRSDDRAHCGNPAASVRPGRGQPITLPRMVSTNASCPNGSSARRRRRT